MARLNVKVKFGSRLQVEQLEDCIEVTLTQPPEKGKANHQLLEALAEHFNLPKTLVCLVSGAKSRKKVVELREIT